MATIIETTSQKADLYGANQLGPHDGPEAETEIHRLLLLFPTSAQLWRDLARIHNQRQNAPQALKVALSGLLRASEGFSGLAEEAALALSFLGRPSEAADILERASMGGECPYSFYSLWGQVLEDLGRLDEAEVAYKKALELSPESQKDELNRAEVLRLLGRTDESTPIFQRLIEEQELCPSVQICSACNLRCSMCAHQSWEGPGGYISRETFISILGALEKSSVQKFRVTAPRGEPLMHRDALNLIRLARERNFQVSLTTNASALTKARAEELSKLRLSFIQISFCGFDKPSYESIYQGAKFEKVTENIRHLVKAVRESGASTLVYAQGVLDDASSCGIGADVFVSRTRSFLNSLGINHMTIIRPSNWGGLLELGTFDERIGCRTYKDTSQPLRFCEVLLTSPQIFMDGQVGACSCFDTTKKLIVGNILKNDLGSIRQSHLFQHIAESFIRGDIRNVPVCNRCDAPYGRELSKVLRPSTAE